MGLKIRLRQQGRKNRAFYRLVVCDSRSPRDGKYVEALGWYNPIESEEDKIFSVKPDRVQYWMNLGAQWTENVECLLKRSCPHLVKEHTQKVLTHKAKMADKRKKKATAK